MVNTISVDLDLTLWMKTIHYPTKIRSQLVTIAPMAPFTPKSTSKLRSALHFRYSKVVPQSKLRPLTTGVPQGSIVGPLLFNILINDIVMARHKFNFIPYGDDTTLNSTLDCFGNGEDESQISITTELQKIIILLDVNKLCLNTAKSKYMLFHMTQKILPELSFSFNEIPIKDVKKFNFLGMIIDSNLN